MNARELAERRRLLVLTAEVERTRIRLELAALRQSLHTPGWVTWGARALVAWRALRLLRMVRRLFGAKAAARAAR